MCKEKRIVYLTGIGMGTKEGMTVRAKESLKGCDCMIAQNGFWKWYPMQIVSAMQNICRKK